MSPTAPPPATTTVRRGPVPGARRYPAERVPGGRPPVGERARTALRYAGPALLGHLAVRLLGVIVLARWTHLRHHGLWPVLAKSWDSNWYLGIAAHGYELTPPGTEEPSNLAFFPLYPVLVKAVAAVTPGSRASVALVLAVVFSLVAAGGVFAVGDRLHGRRTATVLTVLWAALPVGVVQWMGYTESLFTALTAWALYCALTGRWVWAGSLAALAGLTRPTGVAIAAAVSLTALAALVRARRLAWRPVLGGLLAPLGWCSYVAWVGLRVGRWDGYFAVQKLWANEWDGGAGTLREMRDLLVYANRPPLFLVVVTLVLLVSGALYVLSLADRQPLVLLVFTGALLLVVLGSGGVYFPRARFLLPGFPLLLPVALALSRARRTVTALVLGAAAVSSAWLGAYMLMVWPGPP
ncbi:hypothetical protein DWB77_03001 [Streptomyces hundungensis]|uniref:Uncharacterized protein n=1 Tax=Streptomyces hundungensis TaxID=1077946 RepID=A0A387HF08_9ACTN|nr:hypothetical protein DWB77_03001 [Streptomyces hundungensis]